MLLDSCRLGGNVTSPMSGSDESSKSDDDLLRIVVLADERLWLGSSSFRPPENKRAGLRGGATLRGDTFWANLSIFFELSVVHGWNSGFSDTSFSLLRRLTRLVDGLHVDFGTSSRR